MASPILVTGALGNVGAEVVKQVLAKGGKVRGRRSRPARKMTRRRKLPEIAAESPASGARFVGRF